MDFETALRREIESRPRLGLRGKRILAVLDARPSKKRTRHIARMERHTAIALSLDGLDVIDWDSVNWKAVFDRVLQLLLAILPFLI